MSDRLIDVRTPLAVSEDVRVEIGGDGTMHVLLPAITLHLDRAHCEQLATTLARALVRLHKLRAPRERTQRLRVVPQPETEDERVARSRSD
jgi:hypothetical protein